MNITTKNAKWTNKTRNVEKLDERDEFGYIMQVDLEYPETLHDFHSGYPLAPEIMNVSAEMNYITTEKPRENQ